MPDFSNIPAPRMISQALPPQIPPIPTKKSQTIKSHNVTQDIQFPHVDSRSSDTSSINVIKKSFSNLKENKFFDIENLEQYCRNNGKEFIHEIISSQLSLDNFENSAKIVNRLINSSLTNVDNLIGQPISIIGAFSPENKPFLDPITQTISATRVLFIIASRLEGVSALLYKSIILREVEKEYIVMEHNLSSKPNKDDLEKMNIIKLWIDKEKKEVKKIGKRFGLEAIIMTPLAMTSLLSMVTNFSPIATTTFSFVSNIIGLLPAILRYVKATKNTKLQKNWMLRFDEKSTATNDTNKIQNLLEKRRFAFEKRKEFHRDAFNTWFSQVLSENNSIGKIQSEFKKQGITLDLSEKALYPTDYLTEYLHEKINDSNEDYLQQYTEHKDAISASTRNALKALEKKKQTIEGGFFKFNLKCTKLTLSLSVITTVIIGILKILAITSIIALSAAALTFGGLAVFALGVGLMVAGLIYLKKRKPNLLKEVLRGVPFKLGFFKIPLTFQILRLQRVRIEQLRRATKIGTVEAKFQHLETILDSPHPFRIHELPQSLRTLFKEILSDTKLQIRPNEPLEFYQIKKLKASLSSIKERKISTHQDEMSKLSNRISTLERKVTSWQQRVAPLQKKINIAGIKDFERSVKYKDSQNLSELLASNILNDPEHIDKDTQSILKQQFGIDIQILSSKSSKNVKEEMQQALTSYFSLADDSLIQFINTQNAKGI